MSHSVEEEDGGLKDLVSRTLTENGALGKIQAQLRASVFLALEDEFREKDIPLCNPRTKELLQTPAGSLAASLVHEFFTCLGLDFSLAVYGPESNLGAKLWDLHTRGCLLKAMSLGEDDDPMTPLLLRLCAQLPVTPAGAAALPAQTNGKPVHGAYKRSPTVLSSANQTTKNGFFGNSSNAVSSLESRNSQSLNHNKIPNLASTNGPGMSTNASTAPKNNVAKLSNSTSIDTNRSSASNNATTSNQPINANTSRGNNNNERASTASSNETSTTQKNNHSAKPNPSRRVSPPDDILSAAPPDTDSSEASSSAGDVTGLLQENRLGIKNEVAGGTEKNDEKEKALSDGDYEDDFSEGSSQSTNSATNDEESSTSSWSHPPLPANKTNNVNIHKKDISGAKDSSKEPSNRGKEASGNLKIEDSSGPRRRSMDLLDDDVSIGDFVSSESSSAREETEDIVYNEKLDTTLDYQEKL